ncbi:hypothetical protein F4810DRAFT_510115 [Camillea tinctor]|nr:hypothetical protein F4810DRAFT_510115 [Camillea tinctor]
MPRSGYDLTNIPYRDRPGSREEETPHQAYQDQAPPASSSSAAPPQTAPGTNPAARHQAGQMPTLRLSPGYVAHTQGYLTFNRTTGRGWAAAPPPTPGSSTTSLSPSPPISRGAPGSGSTVLAAGAMGQSIPPEQYLTPEGSRHLVQPRRRVARETPLVHMIVPGTAVAGPSAGPSTEAAGAPAEVPALILTAPSSSSEEDEDVEMEETAASGASKGKGKERA